MRTRILKLATIASLLACLVPAWFSGSETPASADEQLTSTGLGNVESLEASYKAWEEEYVKNGGDRNMVVPMGSFKGLSTVETYAHGTVKLNIVDGTVSVEAMGLPDKESYEFWMVDNGTGSSVLPDSDDDMKRVGGLKRAGNIQKLEANLGSEAFEDFDPDLFIVTRAGKDPPADRVIVGTTTLFHRLYRSSQRGHFGVLADSEQQPAPAKDERGVFEKLISTIIPTAEAQIGPIPNPSSPLQVLITQGRSLFNEEEFNGNGRTCATCHRENNNLTVDAEFIATLPPNDALFVAEFTPALSANFENPVLMRKFGLILENVDGFTRPGVMRGVPHTLALIQNTLTPVGGGGDGTTTPPNQRTGWGGDGAPGTGTLREFAIGAVTQHFTKRLNRVAGTDFRLPTNAELDAMEAFQRSTGRQADLVLSGPGALSLKSEIAARGQVIFTSGGSVVGQPNAGAGKCFFCHLNAGASDFFFPNQNANFNTNVEQLPSQPADLVTPPQPNPPDGGFGASGTSPSGGFGNGSFNTPVVVEAADTGPFFHNNAITTIEGAVDFYNSNAFNQAPGFGALIGGIRLEATEVEAVAAFLRVINALENIRSSVDLENRAKNATSFSQAQELIKLSIAELEDAREVLDCGNLHPEAQQKLLAAAAIDALALITSNQSARNALINQAIALKNAAKSDLAN